MTEEKRINVGYSTTDFTNQNVLVKMTSETELKPLEGWDLSEDKKSLTRVYEENITEEVRLEDVTGQTYETEITIVNIDKVAPTISTTNSLTRPTTKSVEVTIGSSKQLKELEGWTLSEDGFSLKKAYMSNATETITVQDLAGNEAEIEVKVKNIVRIGVINKPLVKRIGAFVMAGVLVAGLAFGLKQCSNNQPGPTPPPIETTTPGPTDSTTPTPGPTDPTTPTPGPTDPTTPTPGPTDPATPTPGPTDPTTPTPGPTDPTTPTPTPEVQELSGSVTYSITTLTNQDVVVTLTTNREITTPAGWTKVNATTYTKTYAQNTYERLTISASDGKTAVVEIRIQNIDKIAPTATVHYNPSTETEGTVLVTITASEDIANTPAGWTRVDARTFTKRYSANTTETVIIRDLAGNAGTVTIRVTNIKQKPGPTPEPTPPPTVPPVEPTPPPVTPTPEPEPTPPPTVPPVEPTPPPTVPTPEPEPTTAPTVPPVEPTSPPTVPTPEPEPTRAPVVPTVPPVEPTTPTAPSAPPPDPEPEPTRATIAPTVPPVEPTQPIAPAPEPEPEPTIGTASYEEDLFEYSGITEEQLDAIIDSVISEALGELAMSGHQKVLTRGVFV